MSSSLWSPRFPPALEARLLAGARRATFADGDLIQGRGGSVRGFWRIESGAVAFTSTAASGRLLDQSRAGPKAWFGEIGLLTGGAPPHEASAVGAVTLNVVPAARFRRMIDEDAEFAGVLLRSLATRLKLAYATLDEFRARRPGPRIAAHLLELTERGPGPIAITHAQLAARLGVARGTAATCLRELVATGAIALSYGRIEVRDESLIRRWIARAEE